MILSLGETARPTLEGDFGSENPKARARLTLDPLRVQRRGPEGRRIILLHLIKSRRTFAGHGMSLHHRRYRFSAARGSGARTSTIEASFEPSPSELGFASITFTALPLLREIALSSLEAKSPP